MPSRLRRDLVPIEREGSLDEDLLEDSSNRIRELPRGQGYRDAQTPLHADPAQRRARRRVPREEGAAVPHRQGGRHRRDRHPSGRAAAETEDAARATVRVEHGRRRPSRHRRGLSPARIHGGEGDAAVAARAGRRRAGAAARVELAVVEGPATIVASIEIIGAHAVPEADLRAGLGSKPGLPFYAPQVALDRDAIVFALFNRGYQTAAVDARIRPSTDRTTAASSSRSPRERRSSSVTFSSSATSARPPTPFAAS